MAEHNPTEKARELLDAISERLDIPDSRRYRGDKIIGPYGVTLYWTDHLGYVSIPKR